MATQVSTNTATAQNGKPATKPLMPPDEKFWKRYSPHHEAPVSGVSSLTLHILIPCLIAMYFFIFGKYLQEANKPLPLSVVAIGNPLSGGGGNPSGVDGGDPSTKEAAAPEQQVKNEKTEPPPPDTPALQVKPQETPTLPKNDETEVIRKQATQATQNLNRLADDTRQQLLKRLQPGNPGKGGEGSGGGAGGGKGTGVGDGNQPGVQGALASDREKRILRWTLRFSTLNGSDYVKQLAGLGAILAVPLSDGSFRLIKDLKQIPARGEVEDINSINRIFWIDSSPDSVQSLSMALRLNPPPPYIVAFFPESLEKRLLEKEKKSSGGKTEAQIKETRFIVERQPNNTYDARVVHQEFNR